MFQHMAPILLASVLLSLLFVESCDAGDHHFTLKTGGLELGPNITRVILNIGCHTSPPAPWDNHTIVVAVEPNPEVAAKIPVMINRYVFTAAVSDYAGVALFNHYDDSSSLLKTNWDKVSSKGRLGAKIMVPVMPLSYLLKTFDSLDCLLVKTDIQGMDFVALKSAHHQIKKCQWVYSEVYCNNQSFYEGAHNDFHKHWVPFMKSMGFRAELDPCKGADAPVESNALFKNLNREVTPITKEECEYCLT